MVYCINNQLYNQIYVDKLKKQKLLTNTEVDAHYHHVLEEHFEIIKKDFYLQPIFLYEIAKLIVCIRRNIMLDQNKKLFFFLIKNEKKYISKNMNLRWIISILDTIADHAEEPDATKGLLLSSLANMIKLCETEKRYFYQEKENPIIDNDGYKYPLFDGMTYYRLQTGDMMFNMFDRIKHNTIDSELFVFYEEILIRLSQNNNLVKRFKELSNL